MSEAGHKGLLWSWPILLLGFTLAVALDFANTMATAMSLDDPIGAPSRDFCVAKGKGGSSAPTPPATRNSFRRCSQAILCCSHPADIPD